MSPRGFVEMPGVRIKFRESDDAQFFTATIWLDGKPLRELARLHTSLAPEAGGEVYQDWIDLVSRGWAAWLKGSGIAGVADVTMLRRKPKYDDEGNDEGKRVT